MSAQSSSPISHAAVPANPLFDLSPDGTGQVDAPLQASFTLDSPSGDAGGVFLGGDFLLIRPTFSEAVAFARGVQTPASIHMDGQALDFDHQPSFRLYGGVGLDSGDELRFTYWNFDGDVHVSGDAAPGTFIVDPFGNLVGAAAVVDPRDGRFVPPPPGGAGPTILVGGDFIQTEAVVDMNVFDLEYRRAIYADHRALRVDWTAGLRVADIDQFYRSFITTAGAPHSHGRFGVEFTGIGPRLGLDARRTTGSGRLAFFARAVGSLLVGSYDVDFVHDVFYPVVFSASQTQSMNRVIPVLESEIGVAYRPTDWIAFAAGWTFQAWYDMGTSGGTFGGFYAGADDANIMTFDGLTLTTEIAF